MLLTSSNRHFIVYFVKIVYVSRILVGGRGWDGGSLNLYFSYKGIIYMNCFEGSKHSKSDMSK